MQAGKVKGFQHLVGVEHDRLGAVAALLRAEGERVDGRLHVRVLRIHQQPRVALRRRVGGR